METTKDLWIGNIERHLFRKMLYIGVDPKMAKKIMSFWMFLESKGFKNIHKNIIVSNNNFLRCVCAEAEVALAFLDCESKQVRPKPSISCPITWTLLSPYLSPTYILGDKENVSKAILALQNDVCNIAFEDILDKRGEKGNPDEGTSENRGIHSSKLNPFAKEWIPVPEDERSLFLTFSKGRPLFKNQIIDCFRRKYGDCVENILIHIPRDREPEFGKIVFKFSWIPKLVLQNKKSVMIYIGEKTICLKKFKSL